MSENLSKKEVVFALFYDFITTSPHLDSCNYSSYNDYKAEQNRITRQRTRALNALIKFRSLPFCADTLEYSLRTSFRGRLVLTIDKHGGLDLEYNAGQYYPVEYRLAAAIVLETYNDLVQRSSNK